MVHGKRGVFRLAMAGLFVGILGLTGCGGGGGSSSSGGTLPQTSIAPIATLDGWTPNDSTLLQYKTYTFAASATDPNIGGAITEFRWDFGDGTTKTTPVVLAGGKATTTAVYSYVASGTPTLSVVAKNAAGLLSTAATKSLTVGTSPSPLTVSFTSPTAATLINAVLGSTATLTYKVNVVYTGFGTVSASGVTLDPGEAGATKAAPVDAGGGNYTISVTYPAAATIGTRTVTPSVKVVDSNGVSSTTVTGPVITIKTVSATNTAPIISLTAASTPAAGTNATWQNVDVVFTAVPSDPDSDPLTLTWDLGDGTVIPGSTELTQTHKYATARLYSVKVTADDGRTGGTKTADLTLNVLENRAPTVVVTKTLPSGNPTKYQRVTLNAAVTDLDGDVPTVTWDFGDLGTATGTSVVHQYQAAGVSTVVVTVADGKGGSGRATLLLTVVENNPPVATVTPTVPVSPLYQNKVYTFTATASDIDTGDTIASYEWDFGDGVVVAGGASQTHTFPPTVSGVVHVKARAIDSRGAVGDWSPAVNFTVAATRLPVVTFTVGDKATFNATTAAQVIAEFLVSVTNPNGAAGTFLLSSALTVTAGDSAGIVGTIINHLDGTYTIPVTYLAGAPARTVAPSVTAVDGLQISSNVTVASATVNTVAAVNVTPVATLVSAPKIAAGTNATWQNVDVVFTATGSDPDSDPLVYTWDFGDKTPLLTGMLGTSALTQTHKFADPGNYSVKLTADDGRLNGTKTADLTMNVLVNRAPTVDLTKTLPSGNPTKYQRVTLNAAATDLDGDVSTLTWNFGDGSAPVVGTATLVHQFLAAGLTNIAVTADDGKGGIGTGTLQLNILENNPPVATMTTASATLYQKKPYTFNATGLDPDATDTLASYEWDFGDGTGIQTSLPLTAATTGKDHAYASTFTGPASVKVRAIDGRGAVGDWSPAVTFTVLADVPPSAPTLASVAEVTPTTASVSLGAQLYQNKDYTFTASAATAGTFPVATYAFDFGDGTPIVPGPITQTHRYGPTVAGPVLVKVQALDSNGLVGAFSATTSFPISASKPVVTFLSPLAPQTSNVTSNAVTPNTVTVSYLFSLTNPNGGAVPALTFTAGDSLATTVTPSGTGPYLYQVAYLQGATAPSSRLVSPTVVALDHLGVYSVLAAPPAITIQTVAAGDTPPVINLATPAYPASLIAPFLPLSAATNTTWQGVPVTFTATASDADNDPLVYRWNFGDSQEDSLVGTSPLAAALIQTHAFTAASSFDVKVTADDGRGASNNKTADLTMNILLNTAPRITINPMANPVKYQVVTFTATVFDDESDPVTVTWNFGDASAPVIGNPVTHQFTTAGPVTVTATADDGKGNGGQGYNGTPLPTATVPLIVGADAPPAALVATPAATLYQKKSYTFNATGSDPDTTDTIASYEWDFGDGTGIQTSTPLTATTTGKDHAYASTFTGIARVKVRAIDSRGAVGDWSPAVTFTVLATPLPVVTFVSPSVPTTLNVDLSPATVTQTFTFTVTNPRAGAGATVPLVISFNANDASATTPATWGAVSYSAGSGIYSVTVTYTGALASGTRTSTPTVIATDSLGIVGAPSNGPLMTLTTLGANHAPSITLTTPATDGTVSYTSKTFALGFTLTDADNDAVTYTVDWGDGSATTSATPTGNFVTGVAVSLSHTYADAFTASQQSVTVRVTATDNRSLSATATPRTRLVTVTYNTLPTATITSPQDSGSAPTGLPGSITPPYVVVPLNGRLAFEGTTTKPGSQDTVVTAWTFPGGVPSTGSGDTPGDVVFAGTAGVITPQTVTYTVTDALGRSASATKQVLVDGLNTQSFNLSFQYRQKSDNNGTTTLTPVTTVPNGLGAPVQIFQDGQSNTYNVQDQTLLTGAKATVSIPVRSDLPFYIKIPGFSGGPDATTYLMRIPNAPTGAYADLSLEATPTADSRFSFQNGAAPFNPTLQVVTAQGFAAEAALAAQRKLNGYTDLVLGATPVNERWLDRLSVPTTDPTEAFPWIQSSNYIGNLVNVPAYQLFAEWPTLLITRKTGDLMADYPGAVPTQESGADPTATAGTHEQLGFVLDYPTYAVSTLTHGDTFSAFSMQAFRVPAGVTDPYQLSPAWQDPLAELPNPVLDVPHGLSVHSGLNPVPVSLGVRNFLQTAVNEAPATALAGGIASLPLPYAPNDPNRTPLALGSASTRSYSNIATVFGFSEYLWSTVWARPLVLNSARPYYGNSPRLDLYPYFRRSNPATWPKASGISPDNSAFDLTAHGGGVFDGRAPVAVGGGTPPSTGVGRFFWTAYTPSYAGDASQGQVISRTWLADEATGQPPTTFPAASATGDATVAFGFMPPQDTIVDKRGRTAAGALSGSSLGGYRVTWYNATKDASGNPVAPDFWVVELSDGTAKSHFMLPGSYPAGTQAVSDAIMTDARLYLPSTQAATAGPAVGDKVGPGYCWFDIPVELRPTTASGVTLTVFGVKSILKNHPVTAARRLNRPDWMDAIKTATATIKVLSASGTDLGYAHKVPFNYAWDIVIANGPATYVAP